MRPAFLADNFDELAQYVIHKKGQNIHETILKVSMDGGGGMYKMGLTSHDLEKERLEAEMGKARAPYEEVSGSLANVK